MGLTLLVKRPDPGTKWRRICGLMVDAATEQSKSRVRHEGSTATRIFTRMTFLRRRSNFEWDCSETAMKLLGFGLAAADEGAVERSFRS